MGVGESGGVVDISERDGGAVKRGGAGVVKLDMEGVDMTRLEFSIAGHDGAVSVGNSGAEAGCVIDGAGGIRLVDGEVGIGVEARIGVEAGVDGIIYVVEGIFCGSAVRSGIAETRVVGCGRRVGDGGGGDGRQR